MQPEFWQRCEMCGEKPTATCSKCRSSQYCSQDCQRRSWVADHKHRCRLSGSLLAARRQLQSQDSALALLTAEEPMKAHASAIKSEAEKALAFDAQVVKALLRGLAAAMVGIADALAKDKDLAQHKVCRACFAAVATMLDLAAALRQERCPLPLWTQVQAIVMGLGQQIGDKGDPVLSAWMLYDSYARGLADRPTVYEGKLRKMRIAALLALRDALAASAALLEDSSTFADACVAQRVDAILESNHLKVCRDDVAALRDFYPKGVAPAEVESDEDDIIEPWHRFS